MDIITLASVVQNGLIQRSRIFTVSVLLPDVPGQLNKVSKVIADVQGNVIKLEHNQFVSVNRNSSVELTITMEAFGHDHKTVPIGAVLFAENKLSSSTNFYEQGSPTTTNEAGTERHKKITEPAVDPKTGKDTYMVHIKIDQQEKNDEIYIKFVDLRTGETINNRVTTLFWRKK